MAEMEKKKPVTGKNPSDPQKRSKNPYADKKGAGKDDKKSPEEKKKSFAYQLIPYIFAVLALFFMLCFITNLVCNPGNILGDEGRENEHILGTFGYYICAASMGVLGHAAFAVPVLLFLFVIFWKNYNKRSFVALNAVLAFVALVAISALMHVFLNMGAGTEAFVNKASLLYEDGAALRGGGVIGGIVSFALVSVLNVAGTIFVLIAILIPIVMFLMGTTPVEVVGFIVGKIRAAAEKGKEEREERKLEKAMEERERKEIEKAEREAERERIKAEREAAALAKKAEAEEKLNMAQVDGESEKDDATEEINSGCVIKIEQNEDAAEEEGEKLKLNVFSEEQKKHIDSIKTSDSDGEEIDDVEIDERGAEKVFPSDGAEDEDEAGTTVFSNPNDKKDKARGVGAVDDLVNERFEEGEFEVDKETGEVFTPLVQNKKPKSANEFREMNETHEEQFIGEKPAPPPIPEYKFPPIDLLEAGSSRYASDPAEIEKNAELLKEVLQDFRIPIKEITCSCGPTLTRYEIKPEAGVRVRQIANLVDDIAMTLAKTGVRIEAPIPGKAAVGIEVPNDKPAAVKLRNILEHADFMTHKSKIASCLGADVSGKPVVFDIEKMPHLLVAGTTGSGKSVCINSIIMSILYHAKPEEVKLLLVDPKQVEFQIYRDIPHLCCRVISNPKKAAGALNLAVNEMEKRFELIKEVGVRNITGYNEATKDDPEKPYMPRMVIIIDEFADLMMTAKEDVETAVVRIAQKARAAGIHLIIGTQRPSVDVITGLIKANIPSRIAFTVMSGTDSRTILDTVGAEKLCGRGDMLYAPVGAQKPQRVQGSFVSDGEVEAVVEWVKKNNAPVIYDNEFESQLDIEAAKCGGDSSSSGSGGGDYSGAGAGDDDSLLFAAADLAVDTGKIATSMLQRRLSVGYGRAAKIIDRLEEMGVVGPPDGTKPRQVLMSREQLQTLKEEMGI
jgi:S-DNA-T family DNA segregation ATPase FtsK/SpoIIIE